MDKDGYHLVQNLKDDITVGKSMASVNSDVIHALSILSVSEEEKAKVEEAIKYLTGIQDRQAASSSDMEKNISDLLGAIGSLAGIADPGISEIRLLMDKMLTFWESGWYLETESGVTGE